MMMTKAATYVSSSKQFLTLSFITIISLIIMRFRRVEVQVIRDEKATTRSMFQKLRISKIFNTTIISLNVLFQTTVILIMIQQQIRSEQTRIDMTPYYYHPHLFNSSLITFTYIFNCLLLPLSTLTLLAVLFLNLISLGKLTCFLTQVLPLRLLILASVAVVTLLYCNDVILMMAIYWGMPAFDQTYKTFVIDGSGYVNAN